MKAFLFRLSCGILAAAILLAAAGCGNGSKGDDEPNTPEPIVTEAAAVTAWYEAETVTEEEQMTTEEDETTAADETTTAADAKATTKAADAKATTKAADGKETTKKAAADATTVKKENTDASGWAAAYQKYLLNVISSYNSVSDLEFGLFYLNNDDIPELWYINGIGAHGPGYQIVTYRGGKAVEFVPDGYFGNAVAYYEKTGVFEESGSFGASGGGTAYYQMTDAGYKKIGDVSEEYVFNNDGSSDPTAGDSGMVVIYKLNGAEATEAECDAFRKSFETRYGKPKNLGEDNAYPLTRENVQKYCK